MKAVDVTVNDLRLRLWDHAPDRRDLPVVLCIHGALDTGRSFDALAAAVAASGVDKRVVAVDLRGHGGSDVVGGGGSYHLLDFLKDLGGVVEQLAAEQAGSVSVVVGHSMGGNLALMLVGALPACTKKLVLLDSVGPPPEDAGEQPARHGELLVSLRTAKKPFAPVADVDEAVARLQKWNPGLSDAGARRMIAPVLVEKTDAVGGRALHFPFDARLRGPTPFRWSEDFWVACCARYRAAGGATVIVRAEDGFVPASADGAGVGAPFDARVNALGAEVVVVDGGHHVHVEHAAVVAGLL